jgi:hypothetical protein
VGFDCLFIFFDDVWGELGDLHQWIISCPHALHEMLLEVLDSFHNFGWHALW